MEPEVVELLRVILLVAIRDRAERLRIVYDDAGYRLHGEQWHQLFVHIDGDRFELVPVPSGVVQEFPVILASWEPPLRAWHRVTSWVRRWAADSQRGRFHFPAGAGSVAVEYRVRWRSNRVRDIEMTIRGADSVVVREVMDPNRLYTYISDE
jgi:hypothetical protein